MLLFQPWIPGLEVFRGDEASSTEFIQVLWQVQGAALGLSLAVVLFVFQSVHGSKLIGGSLRDFAEETWLFPIFYAGLLGLMLDGLVLLHFGTDAPGGWAASWAVLWAAGTAVGLGFLFVFTIRAIDPRALHRRRLTRTSRAIQEDIEDVIFRRIAVVLLNQFCERRAIEYAPFGMARRNSTMARSPREGEVRDIQLRRLGKIAAEAADQDLSKPVVRVEIGSPVRAGTELASLDAGQEAALPSLIRVFRVGRPRQERFRAALEDLHEEALLAIRAPSPATYSAISELYEKALLALPETWARYGQEYVGGVAGGASPFELTVQDHLERQLYEEMTQAARSDSIDVAHDALDLPIVVASRAHELRALALTKRMLGLWVAARRAMLRDADREETRNLLEWSWLRMSEYAFGPERLIAGDEADPESQELGRDLLLQVWDAYASLCKDILDARPADTELLVQINEFWDQPLRHWNPEHADPQHWDLQFAIERGDDLQEIERLRGEVAANQRQIALKEDILDWRILQRFGLLFWIFRNVRDRGDAERWIPAWSTFAPYFADVPSLAAILDKGIEADWQDRGRWSNWVFNTLRRREFHGIAVDLEFVQTFIVLALTLTSPDGPPPEIEPLENGRGRLDDPRGTVNGVLEIVNIKPLLPPDRLRERAEHLIAGLEAMNAAEKANAEQAVIDADLDEGLIQGFAEALRTAWRPSRTLRAAFSAFGAIEPLTGELAEGSGSQATRWLDKSLFVRDSHVVGLDRIAEDYGQSLARWEWKALLDVAQATVPLLAAAMATSLAERVRAAILELRAAGYEPSVIVAPFDWRALQALEVTPAARRGGEAAPPPWLEGEEQPSFVGDVEGVPVVEDQHASQESLYILDLARFARFHEPEAEDPLGPVSVEITRYDATSARELVQSGRVRFDDDLDEEARIRLIQQRVLLEAVYPFELELQDSQAGRRVELDGEGDGDA